MQFPLRAGHDGLAGIRRLLRIEGLFRSEKTGEVAGLGFLNKGGYQNFDMRWQKGFYNGSTSRDLFIAFISLLKKVITFMSTASI